jgi:hypothetical protein
VDDFITFEPLRPSQIKQIVVLRAQVGRHGKNCYVAYALFDESTSCGLVTERLKMSVEAHYPS